MTMNENNLSSNQSDFILYTSNEGDVKVEVVLQDENIWLTQKAMGSFSVRTGVLLPNISGTFSAVGNWTKKAMCKKCTLHIPMKAEQEYEEYRVIQDRNYISDFDREVQRIRESTDDYN